MPHQVVMDTQRTLEVFTAILRGICPGCHQDIPSPNAKSSTHEWHGLQPAPTDTITNERTDILEVLIRSEGSRDKFALNNLAVFRLKAIGEPKITPDAHHAFWSLLHVRHHLKQGVLFQNCIAINSTYVFILRYIECGI